MAEFYEGAFWQAQVTRSNRFGTRIIWSSVGSDSEWSTPKNRIQDILARLEAKENVDAIAQSLPIDEKNPRNAGRKPTTGSGKRKVPKSIKVDPELWEQAKAAGIKLAIACEDGLRDALAKVS